MRHEEEEEEEEEESCRIHPSIHPLHWDDDSCMFVRPTPPNHETHPTQTTPTQHTPPQPHQGFTMVLNALDNIDARRHVNKMCLATDKPMIDAGTTGYVGQATVVRKGQAACYECEEKAAQKVYPICTIRATPDKPVHCVVWAKEAYRLLFGQRDASMLFEAPDAPEPSLYMPVVNAAPVAFPAAEGSGQEQQEQEACSVDEALAYGGRVLKVCGCGWLGVCVVGCRRVCVCVCVYVCVCEREKESGCRCACMCV
jgi:molybdopterin/thiamine biosynthesis adenylyltransferase